MEPYKSHGKWQRGKDMKVAKTGIIALLCLAGCSSGNMGATSQDHDYGKGAFGPGPLNFEHMKNESFDPEMTNTGASYKDPSVKHRTLEDDARQVEAIVQKHGFRSGAAFVNGGHIYVKAHPDEKWSKSEIKTERSDLQKALKAEIPRYDVHLR